MTLKYPEATAVFMGFQNALHDAIHAGLLSPEQLVGVLMVAARDTEDLLAGRNVEIRGHDGKTLSLDSAAGENADRILQGLAQSAAESKLDPALPAPTVATVKGVLN